MPCGHTNDCPILRTAIELLKAPTGPLHLWHANFDQHFIGSQVAFKKAFEKVRRRNFALPLWSLHDVSSTEGQSSCGQIACWVGVGDRATDCATVTNLRVANMARRFGEKRCVLVHNF